MNRLRLSPALLFLFVLAGLVLVGMALLMLPASSTRPLAWNEALFTAVSALTCTGLSVFPVGTDLTRFGQSMLLLLIQVGGIAYMTFAVVLLQLIGRQISVADRLDLKDAFGSLKVASVFVLFRFLLLLVLGIELVGALLLWFHWQGSVPGVTFFDALFHAVSAFCNAGFDLFGGNPGLGGGVFPTDGGTLLVKACLILLGGLGAPVLFDLTLFPKQRRLTLHTRITLVAFAFLFLFGFAAIFLSERPGTLASLPLGRQIELSMFQSVSSRSAGFAGLSPFEAMQPGSQLAIIALMFIGCGPASTGGGITTGTFATLALAVLAYARGSSTPRVGGRAIPGEMVRKASAVLTISLLVVVVATWVLLVTHDTSLDRALFEVVSAFATCGLTLAFTSELTLVGQIVIMLVMFWGRLGALTVIFALTRPGRVERVFYPEEKILIG
ncbi:MAG TPA: potassium transporter TrkG [Fimbriimonadaceae bacterium]|nr:potassium transporter TrkG [Fimbriimonadaceae bacterium]